MIKSNEGLVSFDGDETELILDWAVGLTSLCDEIGRGRAISSILSAYYSMLAEERGLGFKTALEMFKDDTKLTLEIIENCNNLPGDTMDEKVENFKKGEDLDD